METQIKETFVLQTDTCCACGVLHAIPKQIWDNARKNGGFWYCPNGHHIGWEKKNSQSDNDRLRAELSAAKDHTEYWRKRKSEVEENLKRKISAQKGQNTKLKNRIKNGVCPCCHRSFTNIRRHIENKHPDFNDI